MTNMAQREEKVTIYACDAPGCSTERVVQDPDALPEGFMGTTAFEWPGGGTTEEWFACTANHIRKAVVSVQVKNNSTNPALPKQDSTTPGSTTPGSQPAANSDN